MSDFDVNEGEMTKNRFSDQDIERFFSGQTPEDEVLAKLTPLVGMLRAHNTHRLSEERVTEFAAEAGKLATTTRLDEAGSAAHQGTVSRIRRFNLTLKRKLATGLASVLLLSGMTGIAVAANDAAPGDTLYGLDQALAAVGILDGGVAEGLEEATALNESSNSADALAHAAEAIAQAGDAEANIEEALAGLDEAIEALTREDFPEEASDNAVNVRTNVAAMLQWMSENADTLDDPTAEPGAFGQGVADLAKEIAGAPDELPDAADNAAEEAAAAEENAGDAGPPEDVPPVDTPAGP